MKHFFRMEARIDSLKRLLPDSSSHEEYSEDKLETRKTRRTWHQNLVLYILAGALLLSSLGNVVLTISLRAASTEARTVSIPPSRRLYSPAQDAVKSKLVKFHGVLEGKTKYMGAPTEETNTLWKDLYRPMDTHITVEEARLLPNKTAPEISYDGSGYAIILNMFHDLHCLDNLRRATWFWMEEQWTSTHNPYTLYDEPSDALFDRGGRGMSLDHLDHCIDTIRQSTLCTADITPDVFQYSEMTGAVMATTTVVHECRDYESVMEWARRHQITQNPGEKLKFGDGEEVGKCAFEDPWTCLYE